MRHQLLESKHILHDAYLKICDMKIPTKRKVRLLSELMGENPDHWRVVGITEQALTVFWENNFKKVSRMGINRSHLVDRHETFTYMLENIMLDIDEWWQYYTERDKTVFATSGENMSNVFSNVIYFEEQGLFRSSGFAWRHSKEESFFLQELYEKMINKNVQREEPNVLGVPIRDSKTKSCLL